MNKVIQIANLLPSGDRHNSLPGRVYSPKGICPCLRTPTGGLCQPMFLWIRPKYPQVALRPRQEQPLRRDRGCVWMQVRHEQIPCQQLFQHRHCNTNVKPKTMDSRNTIRPYIIGQSHDSKGNLANYHTVKLWPCVVGGCSRNRLTRILWIDPCQ